MMREGSLEQLAGDGNYPWFALRVRSNFERVVALHLRSRGFDEFAPTFRSESKWSDRKRQVDRFLFPGYVFCRVNPDDRLPVLSIPGAVGLVGFGKGPTPIAPSEIESIRTMVGAGLLVGPWPFIEPGQTVLIEQGPLRGVEGILQEAKRGFRLVVSVQLLQRSVSAEVDRDWIRPVATTKVAQIPPVSSLIAARV